LQMRYLLFLVALMLPVIARAQVDQENCLSDQRKDNRISGTVEKVSRKNPSGFGGEFNIAYRIILLKPRCYDYWNAVNQRQQRDEVERVTLIAFWHSYLPSRENKFFKTQHQELELEQYLEKRIGTLVTVTGTMVDYLLAPYISAPQISVISLAPCEIQPTLAKSPKC